jgi:hypothetical protein
MHLEKSGVFDGNLKIIASIEICVCQYLFSI